jgi:fibronectin type 3 domain-containing protein
MSTLANGLAWTMTRTALAVGMALALSTARVGAQDVSEAGEGRQSQERLVRGAYVKLMRYQRAYVAQAASEPGAGPAPDELRVELRNARTGPVAEILQRPVAELASPGSGLLLRVEPIAYRYQDGPEHLAYRAVLQENESGAGRSAWSSLTVAEVIARRGGTVGAVRAYTAYEVGLHLGGRERTYRALALYQGEPATEGGEGTVDVVDNVIGSETMARLLIADAPPVRAPWKQYVLSPTYAAVAGLVSAARQDDRGIGSDAPAGALLGDDAVPSAVLSSPALASPCVVVTVNIKRNGQIITDTTQNATVGEKVVLEADVQPPGTAFSITGWTVAGNPIANYTANTGSGRVTRLGTLTQPAATFYWVEGGNGRPVTLTVSIGGQPTTVSATFNVKRPSATVTATVTGTVAKAVVQGTCSMQFGDPNAPSGRGIVFRRTLEQGVAGTTAWVQIAYPRSTRRETNNTCWLRQGPGLDATFPYGGTLDVEETADSPRVALEIDAVAKTAADEFDMWLLFMPPGNGSIWVPLKKVHWGWTGNATQNGTGCAGWTVSGNGQAGAVADSTTHPEWDTLANVGLYQPDTCAPGLTAPILTGTAGDGQVGLSWTAPPGATEYALARSTQNGGNYTQITPPSFKDRRFTDTGVTNNTTYFYVVLAVNATSQSGLSNQVTATPRSGLAQAPAPPENVTATAGAGQVTLNWSASTGATGYIIKRALVSGGPYTDVASPTAGPHSDGPLANGTTYYYVVSAVNGLFESVNSTEARATPVATGPPPPAPKSLTARVVGTGAELTWSASAGAVSYNVKRSLTNGGPYTTIRSVSGSPATDAGPLTKGTTYYYVVTALSASGAESPNSNQASVRP